MPDQAITAPAGEPAVARGYARGPYRDLILRQFLGQPGDQAHHFGGAGSPDLVVAGTEPVDDPEAAFGSAEAYGTDPSAALTGDAANYLYPRTRMPEGVALPGLGRLILGVAPPTAMLWPDRLEILMTAGGQSHVDVDVPAGAVGVAADPFVTAPDTDPACTLGGYVYTVDHPIVLPKLGSLPELAAWLYETPGFAQRCVGSIAPGATVEQPLAYEHRGDEPVRVMFHLRWSDCPGGWEVGLEGDHGISVPATGAVGSAGIAIHRTFDSAFTARLTWHLSGGKLEPTTTFSCGVYLVRDGDGALVPLGSRMLRPAAQSGGTPETAAGGQEASSHQQT